MKVLLVAFSLIMVGCSSPQWGDYRFLDTEVLDAVREASMPEAESPYIYDDVVISDASNEVSD